MKRRCVVCQCRPPEVDWTKLCSVCAPSLDKSEGGLIAVIEWAAKRARRYALRKRKAGASGTATRAGGVGRE